MEGFATLRLEPRSHELGLNRDWKLTYIELKNGKIRVEMFNI